MHDLMPIDPSWTTWRERFAWHMGEIPNLIGETLRHRNPTRAARYDREIVDGGGPEGTPAPLNVDAVDDADELWRALAGLAETVDGWFNTAAEDAPTIERSSFVDRMPVMQSAKRGGVVVGVHPLLDEHEALVQAGNVVAWLIRMGGEVKKRTVLVEAAEAVEPIVRRLRLRYLVERKKAGSPLRRRCRTCGEVAVVVEWAEMVSASKPMGVGRCTSCGQLYVELS